MILNEFFISDSCPLFLTFQFDSYYFHLPAKNTLIICVLSTFSMLTRVTVKTLSDSSNMIHLWALSCWLFFPLTMFFLFFFFFMCMSHNFDSMQDITCRRGKQYLGLEMSIPSCYIRPLVWENWSNQFSWVWLVDQRLRLPLVIGCFCPVLITWLGCCRTLLSVRFSSYKLVSLSESLSLCGFALHPVVAVCFLVPSPFSPYKSKTLFYI